MCISFQDTHTLVIMRICLAWQELELMVTLELAVTELEQYRHERTCMKASAWTISLRFVRPWIFYFTDSIIYHEVLHINCGCGWRLIIRWRYCPLGIWDFPRKKRSVSLFNHCCSLWSLMCCCTLLCWSSRI
jgi:hypothetical protein